MEPFIGQIQTFAFNYAPQGWSRCDGQELAITSNQALYALIGNTFGGNGRTTFALPDLRGRSVVHTGRGPGLDTIEIGSSGGSNLGYLTIDNIPSHSHTLTNGTANVKVGATAGEAIDEADSGSNGIQDGGTNEIFTEEPTTANFIGGVEVSGSTDASGSGHPFSIRPPFLGMGVCIATIGLFPPRQS
tara:strand:+ start:5888 stop:6451 length:564 start_codon:yes stop_codon:yes gene_type:complete